MQDIFVAHAARYPKWSVEDLYKLIHQSAMGSEHAITEESKVEDWLVREIEEMGQGPEEPLLDPIAPDGSILRVHLRPFVQHGFDRSLLISAFIQTARGFQRSQKRIEEYWESVTALARDGTLKISVAEITRFFGEMKSLNYPAVHHSAIFSKHYQPAYRVVADLYLPQEIFTAA